MIRYYAAVLFIALSFFSNAFSQNNTREEIVKWANFYLNKKYKYNQSDTITNPYTKKKKKVNFDCSGFINTLY